MKNLFSKSVVLFVGLALFSSSGLQAQSNYSDQKTLTDRLKKLSQSHKSLTNLRSLAKSPDGNDVWLLTIGTGDVAIKPAVAIIGGAEGSHILGTELTLEFAENLLSSSSSDSIKSLLETTTFYVMPSINPDAAQQYFASLKFERGGNGTSTDDDRDGSFDEDGFDDLDKDGLITWMRIEDPTGKWMISSEDVRVMVKADASKGQKGTHHVFSEGRDNDNDGKFNEDGVGGVNINKNFTYDFPYFQPGSGENTASEPEILAVLDFLYEEARNTFAVVSFGPENNLSSPVKFNRAGVSKRVISGWYEEDVAINKLVSKSYNSITGTKGAPTGAPRQGDLFQWAYFHYGRYSFSTPGWWTPSLMDDKGKAKKFKNPQSQFLAWADSNDQDVFVNWTEMNHPDFPGKKVEVGGTKPFSSIPPYALVDSIGLAHTEFLIQLAEMKPSLSLENMTIEKAGKNLTRITIDIYNGGTLPTASRLGTRTRWVRNVLIDIELSNGLTLVSGPKRSYESTIKGDEHVTRTWLVQGEGSASIKAGSPQSGFSTIKQTIK